MMKIRLINGLFMLVLGALMATGYAAEQTARVVGGQPVTEEGKYPWALAVVEAGKSPTAGHYCGATLIAPTWAVTAAHCLTDPPRRDYVAADVQLAGYHLDLGEMTFLSVKQIIVHPHFSFDILENDIALLELTEPSTLPTITLLDETNYPLPSFLESVLMGWGSINNSGRYSNTLMAVTMPLLDNQSCEKLLVESKVIGAGEMLDSMLCAGGLNLGRDSCTGDSGSPLVIHDPTVSDDIIQIGLVSYGARRCGDLPGVYTRLSSFQSFIKSYVAEAKFKSLDPSLNECQAGITPIPQSPGLTVSMVKDYAELNWTNSKFAQGYTLFYLPFNYTDISELGMIDLQQQTFIKGHLENPQSYYVAIQAYNCTGTSELSNVGLLWFF